VAQPCRAAPFFRSTEHRQMDPGLTVGPSITQFNLIVYGRTLSGHSPCGAYIFGNHSSFPDVTVRKHPCGIIEMNRLDSNDLIKE